MKKDIIPRILIGILTLFLSAPLIAEEVMSLRHNAIAEPSEDASIKYYFKDRPPISRDYLQQPPLIPHKIDNYIVNIKHNKCLSCHSWKNYRAHNATKISQTHFENSNGTVLANVSARRYFCQQCHVPQVDAPPLVENTFQPLDAMRIR